MSLSVNVMTRGPGDRVAAMRLGWAPRVGLREGLTRSLDYYRQHAEDYWP